MGTIKVREFSMDTATCLNGRPPSACGSARFGCRCLEDSGVCFPAAYVTLPTAKCKIMQAMKLIKPSLPQVFYKVVVAEAECFILGGNLPSRLLQSRRDSQGHGGGSREDPINVVLSSGERANKNLLGLHRFCDFAWSWPACVYTFWETGSHPWLVIGS